MKTLLTGNCDPEQVYTLVDPTKYVESEFEAEVVKALTCLFPEYWCGVFAGTFTLENERRTSDLALIHKRLSHWFVIEVELAGHSLEYHILPQVRCFRFGEPEDTCVTSLVRGFSGISPDEAKSVLLHVPRFVLVVGNLPDREWVTALTALDAQYLTVSVLRARDGRTAHEVEGRLVAPTESLGFARFSSVTNCLRIHRSCGLPSGKVQIVDQFGNPGTWDAREESGVLWLLKERGPALLSHDSYVQIIRSHDGRIFLKPSAS